ncbi:hypothetical protein [Methylobacillus flagellatus]|uniref:hypothetical protein n=1 Tax=Methylobacillus flagellatus TaxID=405 RepID=UPI001E4EF122|nr:hypothetical protein [Methylobacillus flagellatus]
MGSGIEGCSLLNAASFAWDNTENKLATAAMVGMVIASGFINLSLVKILANIIGK